MEMSATLRMCRRENVFASPQSLAPGNVRLGHPEIRGALNAERNAGGWVTGGPTVGWGRH